MEKSFKQDTPWIDWADIALASTFPLIRGRVLGVNIFYIKEVIGFQCFRVEIKPHWKIAFQEMLNDRNRYNYDAFDENNTFQSIEDAQDECSEIYEHFQSIASGN